MGGCLNINIIMPAAGHQEGPQGRAQAPTAKDQVPWPRHPSLARHLCHPPTFTLPSSTSTPLLSFPSLRFVSLTFLPSLSRFPSIVVSFFLFYLPPATCPPQTNYSSAVILTPFSEFLESFGLEWCQGARPNGMDHHAWSGAS